MIFIVIIIGCILGAILGMNAPMISYTYSSYLAIAVIAALDSVFGGIASVVNKKFDMKIFISSFPNMNDEIDKMRKNKSALIDREVMIDLMIAISKFTEDPSSQKKLI